VKIYNSSLSEIDFLDIFNQECVANKKDMETYPKNSHFETVSNTF